MSNKQIQKQPRGRPRANSHKMMITLAEDDYQLLDSIANMTSTRPATMIRDIFIQNRPMLLGLQDALKASLSGDRSEVIGYAAKLLSEVQNQSKEAQQELKGLSKK